MQETSTRLLSLLLYRLQDKRWVQHQQGLQLWRLQHVSAVAAIASVAPLTQDAAEQGAAAATVAAGLRQLNVLAPAKRYTR